jgi:hypothetical protein
VVSTVAGYDAPNAFSIDGIGTDASFAEPTVSLTPSAQHALPSHTHAIPHRPRALMTRAVLVQGVAVTRDGLFVYVADSQGPVIRRVEIATGTPRRPSSAASDLCADGKRLRRTPRRVGLTVL